MPLRDPDELRRHLLSDPLAQRLAEVARRHDRPIALVGGWVRDWLLDRPALDWDLVLPGDPTPLAAEIAKAARGPVVTLDAEFGVVRTRLENGLTLDLVRQQGESLEADLARRDLTVNALACDLATGTLIDPTGGLADLEAGVLRSHQRSNLADDPLRLLRVYRFAATLGFAVEAETEQWVRELAPAIAPMAGERVLAELAKLLSSPRAGTALADAASAGLLSALFPELASLSGVEKVRALVPIFDTLDERTRALLAAPVSADRPARALVLLGVLFGGLGDAAIGAIAKRLKWSNKEQTWVVAVASAQAHVQALGDEAGLYRFAKALGPVGAGVLVAAGLTDRLGDFWAMHDRLATLPRLLTGHDLARELGLAPGPHFAPLLAGLEEAQVLGTVRDRSEALAWAARFMAGRE